MQSAAGDPAGLLLVDKPSGWTSHDVVAYLRSRLKIKKAGHAGTLDPMATGLMLILFGKATKKADLFSGMDKSYSGSIRLGVETDTWDIDGKVLSTKPVPAVLADQIQSAMNRYQGEVWIEPPAYSAIKKNGKKSYERARSGERVIMEKKAMRIDRWELLRYMPPEIHFAVDCSKGTYVRSLAHELGASLSCGASLSSLVRTRIGSYELAHAVKLEVVQVESASQVISRIQAVP